ncbi:MAG: hypothetical protein SW019_12305 [Actinomycetota bacterium]|nr:hypothetical protein [Actinomycetota bacterium]
MVISLRRRDLGALFGPAHPGIVLDVAAPPRSALAVQVAPPDLLRVCQSGSTLISARVDGVSGAHWLRHRHPDPVVAPIGVALAEQLGPDLMRWAHHFATELASGVQGPLRRGRWILRPVTVRGCAGGGGGTSAAAGSAVAHWRPDVGGFDEEGYLDWRADHADPLLPLRRPSPPDAARVKAFTKLARAGLLPPVLIWQVTGLRCWLVIDGHDRLTAAVNAGIVPPVLGLATMGRRDEWAQRWYRQKIETVAAQGRLNAGATEALGAELAERQIRAYLDSGFTPADPIPDGAAERHRQARDRMRSRPPARPV